MPAEGNTNLLLSMGLDLSPVHSAAETVKTTLNSLNTLAEQVKATATAAASSQSAEMKQLRDAAQQAVLLAKEAVAQAKGQTANLSVQNAELKNQLVTQQALVKTSQANLLDEKARTVEIQRQTAEYRLQELQKKASGGGASGGVAGALGGLGGQVSKGLLGGGLAGGVAGGLLAGAGVAGLIMAAGEALSGFITKMKEVTLESGKLTILEDVFHGLARGAGVDATAMMQKMQTATEGLVSKVTLLKAANTELRSPLHLTTDQISQLMSSVTKLSEAAGNTAETGITRLNMAFLRGRPMILSTVLGVQGLRDVMRDMPPGLSAAERTTIQWTRALKILNDQAAKLGTLPVTLEQVETRLHVAVQNMEMGFGMELGQSTGMKSFMKVLDDLSLKFGGMEGLGRKLGDTLGDVFGKLGVAVQFVEKNFETLKTVLSAVVGLGITYMFVSMGASLLALIPKIGLLIDGLDGIRAAFTAIGFTPIGLAITGVTLAVYGAYKGFDMLRESLSKTVGESVSWGEMLTGILDKIKQIGTSGNKSLNQIIAENKAASKPAPTASDRIGDIEKERVAAQDAYDAKDGKSKMAKDAALLAAKTAIAAKEIALAKTVSGENIAAADEAYHHNLDNLSAEYNAKYDARQKMSAEDKKAATVKYLADAKAIQEAHDTAVKAAPVTVADLFKTIAPNTPPSTGPTAQQKTKDAQADLQKQLDAVKHQLEAKKDAIAESKALDDEAYKYESESLEKHYANMRQIADDSRDAEKVAAKKTFEAKKADLDATRTSSGMDAKVYNDKLATYEQDLTDAYRKANHTRYMAEIQDEDAHQKDLQEIRSKAIQNTLKNQGKENARKEDALQSSFGQGEVDPQDYLQQQFALIDEMKQHKIDAANAAFDVDMDHATRLQTKEQAIFDAEEEARLKKQKEEEEQGQRALSYVDKKFQPQQAAITAQISGLQPGQNPNELQRQMADLLAKERVELEQMLQDPALRQFSDGWNQVYSKMEQVYSQQQKYNDELRKSADLMTPLADGLKSVSGLLDSIWSSKFVKGLSASLSGGIAALQGSQKAGTQIREALHPESTTVPKDPQMQALENAAKSAANTFGGVQTSADKLIDSLNSVTAAATATAAALSAKASGDSSISFDDNGNATRGGTQQTKSMSGSSASGDDSGSGKPSATERFTSGMIAATGEITNFADALHHSTSALGGAAGGAVGGAGIGNTISGALSMAGPMGAIAGAVVGGVMGAISGHKNAEMSSELSQMNSQYTSLMDAFHANTDNLQVTINELQNLMAEAAEEQANSKKGGQAFGSLISQYSQELSQLQDQQSSIISSLETQLAIFDTPTGMQQFLTNLDTIIQQYDKFAGAAENASQLAQANSWLTDSLSSYTAQMENTFVNDEEGGISDALQLNSLLSERSTMISQLGNSIQNVLEQGVLTRQQTGAQKKGQQIYQLESAASLQMTSINNEISLETYKVGIETSLYNLGMTSMALQGQLLVLQEAQASQSLASISALQTLMDTLNGGGYSGTLSSILTLLGYGAAAGNIPAGTTTSPYGPIGGTPIGGLDALVSAAYQSRATLGYAGFRGSNI